MQNMILPPSSHPRPQDVPADNPQPSDAMRDESIQESAATTCKRVPGGIQKDILHVIIDERVRFEGKTPTGCHAPQPAASMKNGSGVFKEYILSKDPYRIPK